MKETVTIGEIWQYHFCHEGDREWLTEAMTEGIFTVDQAIEYGAFRPQKFKEFRSKEMRNGEEVILDVDMPEWYFSRIYSKQEDGIPICWLLTKIHNNTSGICAIATHPDHRGNGITRDLINALMQRFHAGVNQWWEPKTMIWLLDENRFRSTPSDFDQDAELLETGESYTAWKMARAD
jgi:GNAT superfamily N-acetyltransferase